MWKQCKSWMVEGLPQNTWENRQSGLAYSGVGRLLKYVTVSPWSLMYQKRHAFWSGVSEGCCTEEEIARGFSDDPFGILELVIKAVATCSLERMEQSFQHSRLEDGAFWEWVKVFGAARVSRVVDERFLEKHQMAVDQLEFDFLVEAFEVFWGDDFWMRWYEIGSDTTKAQLIANIRLRLSKEQMAYILEEERWALRCAYLAGVNAQAPQEVWESSFERLIEEVDFKDGHILTGDLYTTLKNREGDWALKIPKEKLFLYFKSLSKVKDKKVSELHHRNLCGRLHVAFLSHPLFCPSLEMLEHLKRWQVLGEKFDVSGWAEPMEVLAQRIPEWDLKVEAEKLRMVVGVSNEVSKSNRKVL
jgi:hypothetical protein